MTMKKTALIAACGMAIALAGCGDKEAAPADTMATEDAMAAPPVATTTDAMATDTMAPDTSAAAGDAATSTDAQMEGMSEAPRGADGGRNPDAVDGTAQ